MVCGVWRAAALPASVAGLLIGVVLAGFAIAADLELQPKPPASHLPPTSPVSPATATPAAPVPAASIEELLAATPDCAEATDKCRVCRVSSGRERVCSNIGIACVPQGWTCTRKQSAPWSTEPKKEQPQ